MVPDSPEKDAHLVVTHFPFVAAELSKEVSFHVLEARASFSLSPKGNSSLFHFHNLKLRRKKDISV